jgi:hypothetical protein
VLGKNIFSVDKNHVFFSSQKVTVTGHSNVSLAGINDSNWMKSEPAEPVFLKVYGAQESISPSSVVGRACTTNRVVVPARQGWESIPELLKRFTNTCSSNPPPLFRAKASIYRIYASLFY